MNFSYDMSSGAIKEHLLDTNIFSQQRCEFKLPREVNALSNLKLLNVGAVRTAGVDAPYNRGAGAISVIKRIAIMDGANPTQSPSYAIDLSDLFPFLKVHSLPLYMIDEPINIELTLRPVINHRVVKITGTAEQSFVLDQNELKFCADYIYYGAGDEMEAFAQKINKCLFHL